MAVIQDTHALSFVDQAPCEQAAGQPLADDQVIVNLVLRHYTSGSIINNQCVI